MNIFLRRRPGNLGWEHTFSGQTEMAFKVLNPYSSEWPFRLSATSSDDTGHCEEPDGGSKRQSTKKEYAIFTDVNNSIFPIHLHFPSFFFFFFLLSVTVLHVQRKKQNRKTIEKKLLYGLSVRRVTTLRWVGHTTHSSFRRRDYSCRLEQTAGYALSYLSHPRGYWEWDGRVKRA